MSYLLHNGQAIWLETQQRTAAHDPHSGQFTSGGGGSAAPKLNKAKAKAAAAVDKEARTKTAIQGTIDHAKKTGEIIGHPSGPHGTLGKELAHGHSSDGYRYSIHEGAHHGDIPARMSAGRAGTKVITNPDGVRVHKAYWMDHPEKHWKERDQYHTLPMPERAKLEVHEQLTHYNTASDFHAAVARHVPGLKWNSKTNRMEAP